MGGLASTEFKMDLTNNNGVDVAFSDAGQSFQHTEETQKAANMRLSEYIKMGCSVGSWRGRSNASKEKKNGISNLNCTPDLTQ